MCTNYFIKLMLKEEGDFIKQIFKDKLLLANFISNLFYSTAYPIVHFKLISEVGEKMISLNSICICLAGIVFPVMWNKNSDKLYKKYGVLCTLETILYILICVMLLISLISSKAYYILDTMFFCLVTKNMICGGNKLRAKRYNNEKDREQYDNNVQLVSNISSLIGFSISLMVSISVNVGFILITIGICSDNFFYYHGWKETWE